VNCLHHPSVKNKRRRRVVLITACVVVSVVVAAVVLDPKGFDKSVEIRFDWEPAKGISDISVEWPPFGSLYNRLIAVQARRHIASYFEKAGWRSAKGRMDLRVFGFLFVLGLDHRSSYGFKIIDPEVTPLMHAAEDGDTASVERLIAKGANVNAQDQRGWTALMHVSMQGQATEAKALLAAGADPNMKDHEGRTAFLWAAWSCRSDVALTLVGAGADVDVNDKYGSTALSSTGCPGVVEDILKKAKTIHKTGDLKG
jgi:hypothetical protein